AAAEDRGGNSAAAHGQKNQPNQGRCNSEKCESAQTINNFSAAPQNFLRGQKQSGNNSARGKLADLHPRGRLPLAQFSVEVEAARFGATKFSARRFWNGIHGENFHDVRREAQRIADLLRDFLRDAVALSEVARFRRDDRSLSAAGFIGRAEGNHASAANAVDAPGDFFDFLGMKIAATLNDHVFRASGDVKLAFSYVSKVTGIEPAVCAYQFARGLGIPVIAGGRRRAAKEQAAGEAFGERAALGVDDGNFHARQWL